MSLLASEMKVRVDHTFFFEAYAADTWPETLPWPDWKPNTEKRMRPMRITFSVHVREDGYQNVQHIVVYGPKLIKNGEGAVCENKYYLGSGRPEFVTALVSEARDLVSTRIKGYR